jgi:Arc/MetJ family transcription regulator
MHKGGYMRTTLIIDDFALKRASELTGVKEKTSLVRMGLEALISKESGKRLAQLGGTEPKAQHIRRRKLDK